MMVAEDIPILDVPYMNSLAGRLCQDMEQDIMPQDMIQPPSMDDITDILNMLKTCLFPAYYPPADHDGSGNMESGVERELDKLQEALERQIFTAMVFSGIERSTAIHEARQKTAKFVSGLPELQKILARDVIAHYEGDPAATNPGETILCYPGLTAIFSYRLAHELHELGTPLMPRMMTERAHSITGIDIHPGAKIGRGFFIDHGTGIVVGETTTIGANVRIYQGVTLGARSFPLDENGNPVKGIARHPIVEDDVIIYSGTTVLGRITIGRGSVIGGNIWLTRDVPPNSRITQTRASREIFHNGGGV